MSASSRNTILVADDDQDFLSCLSGILSRAGYRVVGASDGAEAMALLDRRSSEIGLAIVDLVLPKADGFQVIGAITRRPSHIKVIAVTGVLRDHFLEICKAMGAEAVLRKPQIGESFPAARWLQTIETILAGETQSSRAGD